MNIFPHTQDRAKENRSTGLNPVDGAAPPPCKDCAAPTPARGHMPFHRRTVAIMDYIEQSLARGYAQRGLHSDWMHRD